MYHANLGLALFYLERLEESITEFTVAIAAKIFDPFILSMRAAAYQLLGMPEEAKRDRELAKSLDSSIVVNIFPYPLPQELINVILDWLVYRDLMACKVTCHKWFDLIQNRNLWTRTNNQL